MKLSSCILAEASLRRNYQDLRFCPQDITEDLETSKRRSLARLSEKRPGFSLLEPGSGDQYAIRFMEEALLPPAFEKLTQSALAVVGGESLYAAVNIEEHLLLKARGKPEDATELIARVRSLEQDLADENYPFARNQRFDYLSYRPMLAGSGLHVSLVLHLPMLSFLKQIRQLSETLRQEANCILKPFGWLDRRNPARLFILTNASSQGMNDEEIMAAVYSCGETLDKKEGLLRGKSLPVNKPSSMADQVWRAYGTLRYARRLTPSDYLNLWSSVRLGAAAEILPLPLEKADGLLSLSRDSLFYGEETDPRTYPFRRADAVRRALSGG